MKYYKRIIKQDRRLEKDIRRLGFNRAAVFSGCGVAHLSRIVSEKQITSEETYNRIREGVRKAKHQKTTRFFYKR